MAWTPVSNYFALVTAGSPGLAAGTVLHGRDDFAVIREDREVWQRLTGGAFQIVWGIDGRPVTRGEAHQLLARRRTLIEALASRTEVRTVDGVERSEVVPCTVIEVSYRPPLHPRQIRPEATGAPTMPRREYEPLAAEPGCNACAARARNLLVAPDRAACEGERNAQHPPRPDHRPRPPHTLPPAPPPLHGRTGAPVQLPPPAGDDAPTPLPVGRGR